MTFAQIAMLIVISAAAMALVAVVLPIAVRVSVRAGFVDRPQGRKEHGRPVPPIGGLVIMPIFLLVAPVVGGGLAPHWPLYLSISILVLTGVMDDRLDLSASIKLVLQLVVAGLMTISGESVLRDLGHLFGAPNSLVLGPLAVPFTMACFVFMINAMNMIDGVDGLAGGLSLVMLGWLVVAALLGHDFSVAATAVLLMGLVAGFLVHNMRYPGHARATVFLGDAGSMALGLVVAHLAINVSQSPTPGLLPIGVALIILIPIVDAFALFIARIRAGRRAFEPGRDHIHHQLLTAGFRPGQVTAILMGIMFVAGWIGVLGTRIGVAEGAQTWLWVAILLGYTFYLGKKAPSLYNAASSAKE